MEEITPLSDNRPFFHVFLTKTHIDRQMVVPAKMHRLLPCLTRPAILMRGGKSWKMMYKGRKTKTFDSGWLTFVKENGVKLGDACIFELMECKNEIIFKVQVLDGDFPHQLLHKIEKGETKENPIVIV